MEITITHRSLKQIRNLLIIVLLLLVFFGFSIVSQLKSDEKSASNRLDSLIQVCSIVKSDIKGYSDMEEKWLKYRVEQAFIDLTESAEKKALEPDQPAVQIPVSSSPNPIKPSPSNAPNNNDKNTPTIINPLPTRGPGLIETKLSAPKSPSVDKVNNPVPSKSLDVQAAEFYMKFLKRSDLMAEYSVHNRPIALKIQSDISNLGSLSNEKDIHVVVDGSKIPATILKVNNENFLMIDHSILSRLKKDVYLLGANGKSVLVNSKNLIVK